MIGAMIGLLLFIFSTFVVCSLPPFVLCVVGAFF